jgi:uncharacterized protein YndB with AHSA1/START domain
MVAAMDDDGTLERDGDRWRLRFDRSLRHAPERVWRALTDDADLAAWFPFDVEGERAAGAPLRFVSRDHDDTTFDGEVTEYDPPRTLEWRWGDGEVLRFELRAGGGGTALTLLATIADRGQGARDAAGWHACLDALALRLDGAEPPWEARERWEQVHPRYVERLGPEAATIGPPGE